ncbi:MAG: cation:dicarboxylase symporter family transporter, partial [Myxococcota bacterium]
MGGGFAAGVLLNLFGGAFVEEYLVEGALHIGGAIFLASLKLLVVPLVFVSLVCGTAALDDITKLGRIGGRTLALYLMTTAIAISLALLATSVVRPGDGFDLRTDVSFAAQQAPSLAETLINLFPSNPVRAMAEGNMLQIIVFAVLFGLAVTMAGNPGKRVLALFNDVNGVILRLVMLLMTMAPYG